MHAISLLILVVLLPVLIWELPLESPESVTYTGQVILNIPLHSAILIGLRRRRHWARNLTIFNCLLWATGPSVVGIAMFMYMIRPEIESHFH
jgi:hypothetical protein